MDLAPTNWSRLRIAVLVGAAAETLIWLGIWIYTARKANPTGDGMEWIAVWLATVVFVPFTLPALILGLIGRWLVFAAVLVAGVAIAYLYAWATSG
jgi:hypothetical protein